jgi:hypothetical protein
VRLRFLPAQLDSQTSLDVKDFLKELPSLKADKDTGRAAWVSSVPYRLVIGESRYYVCS